MIDDTERVVMRADAYADEAIRQLRSQGRIGDAAVAVPPTMAIAELHALIRSAFFVGYSAASLDGDAPRRPRK